MHSEETKARIRAAWVKRRPTFEPPMKGKRMSEDSRRKMSEAARNRPSNRLGIRHTPESRRKMSLAHRETGRRGPAINTYKDGKVAERRGQRFSAEYQRWRRDVYIRDRFACRACGDDQGGNLVAHHIESFAANPARRLDVGNGATLCRRCHDTYHWGRPTRGQEHND